MYNNEKSRPTKIFTLTAQRLFCLCCLILLSLSCILYQAMIKENTNASAGLQYYYGRKRRTMFAIDNKKTTQDQTSTSGALASNHLLDLQNFEYTLDNSDPNSCDMLSRTADNGSTLLLIVLVHSKPANAARRLKIREAWAKEHDQERAAVVFLLGLVLEDEGFGQNELESENNQYGDILQGNFIDSYHNLSYKHTMALKYVAERCTQVPYILKCDDDVIINGPVLLNILQHHQEHLKYNNNNITSHLNNKQLRVKRNPQQSYWNTKTKTKDENINLIKYESEMENEIFANNNNDNFIYCVTNENAWVRRSYRSKWRVSPLVYPDAYYPTYCSGGFVLYTKESASRIYMEAQRKTSNGEAFLWIDDVYFTGTIAKSVQTRRIDARKRQLTPEDMQDLLTTHRNNRNLLDKGLLKYMKRIRKDFLIGPWEVQEQDWHDLWELIYDGAKFENSESEND